MKPEEWKLMAKSEADYRKGTPEEHCGKCKMFKAPHACTLIEGIIQSTDICDYYEEK